MTYWRVFLFTVRQSYLTEARYPLQTLVNLVSAGVFLGAILWGSVVSGMDVRDSGLTLLFCIAMVASLQGTVRFLDNKTGELEEVFLHPVRPVWLLIVHAQVALVASIGQLALLFILLQLFVGRSDSALYTLIPYVIPVHFSMVGLGLVIAGCMILFKKIGPLVNLLSLLILSATLAPSGALEWLRGTLPLAAAVASTRGAPVSLLTIGVISATYFVVGFLVFSLLERLSIRVGSIGFK